MSFLAPYMDTSQKEDGTNPQGAEEQDEELPHHICHFTSTEKLGVTSH